MDNVESYSPAQPLKPKTFKWKLVFFFKILYKVLLFFGLCVKEFMNFALKSFGRTKTKEISGKLVLVTGGANGLGRELCLKFAENGCNVLILDIDIKNAEKTVKDVQKLGSKAKAFCVDVSDYTACEIIKNDIEEYFGPVDILVNNAGIISKLPLASAKPEAIKRVIDVNILSYFNTIRLFLNGMVKQKRGHIVSISSGFAFVPSAWLVPYTTSKSAVKAMMEGLEEELFLEGHSEYINTTCVYPTLLNTRKEIVEAFNFNDYTIFSPEYAAHVILEAVKAQKQHVSVPPNRLRSFMTMSLMPATLRRAFQKAFYIGEKGEYFVN